MKDVYKRFGTRHHCRDRRGVHQSKLVIETPQELEITEEKVDVQEEETSGHENDEDPFL
jgi:hypothetical protein